LVTRSIKMWLNR